MMNKALGNKKIASIFMEEGKSISSLFGGFSLALLAVPMEKFPSTLEMVSIFVSSLSAVLLVILAYVLTVFSGLSRSQKHDVDSHLIEFAEIDQKALSGVGALVLASIFIFILNIILVCFRVHWVAGVGGLTAFGIILGVVKYIGRPPS